jgi:predicted permease
MLHEEDRTHSVSPAALRLRRGLVIVQITLAFVLLASAGLLGVSFNRVISVRPGFDAEQVLSGRIDLPSRNYEDEAARLAFIESLLAELRGRPEVTFAAASTFVPLSGDSGGKSSISAEGIATRPGDQLRNYQRVATVGDPWQTLHIPLRDGRLLEMSDNHRAQKVCVVDEALARYFWPTSDAIGRRISLSDSFDEALSFTVVGVVGSVILQVLTVGGSSGSVYVPHRYDTASGGGFHVVLRTDTDPASFSPSLRKIVSALNPELPVIDLRPLRDRMNDGLTLRRASAVIVGLFAVVALLLAGFGLYGVMACTVSQRTGEFGIRMALGARRVQVLKLVLRAGFLVSLAGILTGLVAALLAARLLSGMVFGIGVHDPAIFLAVSMFLASVLLIASIIPATRAARSDPWNALRNN